MQGNFSSQFGGFQQQFHQQLLEASGQGGSNAFKY